MAETEQLRTYRGNCHCGAFVYEVRLPEIKSVFECNCSICSKKGYLLVFPSRLDQFSIVKGDEDTTLSTYEFGSMTVGHKFCPNCASPVMVRRSNGPMGRQLALNVHAIQGVNTWMLERIPIDGASLGALHEPPPHNGALPTAVIDNDRLYVGGCHCGAVTLALMSKPLDETFDELVVKCNCSVCERNGYIWIYPKNEQVVLAGSDDCIGRYGFSHGFLAKTFCKTCGINLTNASALLPKEKVATLSEQIQKFDAKSRTQHPVNLRAFPDVDLSKLTARENHGADKIFPLYKSP